MAIDTRKRLWFFADQSQKLNLLFEVQPENQTENLTFEMALMPAWPRELCCFPTLHEAADC